MVDKIVYTYKFTTLPNIDALKDECKVWLYVVSFDVLCMHLAEIAENLSNQVSKPVQWVSSMNRLKKYGLDMHLEFGPNKVLSGLAKQNRVTGEFASLDNIDKFKELLSKYGK